MERGRDEHCREQKAPVSTAAAFPLFPSLSKVQVCKIRNSKMWNNTDFNDTFPENSLGNHTTWSDGLQRPKYKARYYLHLLLRQFKKGEKKKKHTHTLRPKASSKKTGCYSRKRGVRFTYTAWQGTLYLDYRNVPSYSNLLRSSTERQWDVPSPFCPSITVLRCPHFKHSSRHSSEHQPRTFGCLLR